MGWVCTYTPLELIYAAGFIPYRVVGHSDPIEHADSYISPNFCQFVKSTIDVAIEGGYEFLEGVVFVNSCDAMRRLYDVWKKYVPSKFTYIIDIPMGYSSLGYKYLRNEFEKLKIALENHTSQRIEDEKVEESIDTFIESRSLFQSINSLRLENPSQINGSEIVNITLDFFKADPKTWNEGIRKKVANILEKTNKDRNNNKPRIILSGSPIHDVDFLTFIEECGLNVVYEEMCTGSKFFDMKIEKTKNPLDSLSKAYLNRTPCARMMKIEERAEKLIEISKKFNTNGIIHHSLKFCDTYLYDVPRLRELLIEKGLSVLFLESDGTLGSLNQLKTRVEAFSEMIRKK